MLSTTFVDTELRHVGPQEWAAAGLPGPWGLRHRDAATVAGEPRGARVVTAADIDRARRLLSAPGASTTAKAPASAPASTADEIAREQARYRAQLQALRAKVARS